MPVEGANLIDEDKASSGGAAATLFRSFTHCLLNNHDANWTSYKRGGAIQGRRDKRQRSRSGMARRS
jgi:hypothetical protein